MMMQKQFCWEIMMGMLTGIKVGDIVRVKLKPLQQIIEMKNRKDLLQLRHYMNEYNVGSNINFFMIGFGDFPVTEIGENEWKDEHGKTTKREYIEIGNHLDNNNTDIYEEIAESVVVIEPNNKFYSGTHGLMITELSGVLYINGVALINDKDADDEDYTQLDKFMAFMEKYITATALEKSLSDDV